MNYYIIHKNSREEIRDLPTYGKFWNSIYGYIVLTSDLRVLFIYYNDNNTFGECSYEDLTSEYLICIS